MRPALMQATSRESLLLLRSQTDDAVRGLGGDETAALAGELFSVVDLLQREPGLRRTLGDSSTDPDARSTLVHRLLDGKVSAACAELAADAAGARWSVSSDLLDGLVDTARGAAFAAAEKDGSLDSVEDDLFRFTRVLEANTDLDEALSDPGAATDRKVDLLRDLIADKASPVAVTLLTQSLVTSRGQTAYDAARDLNELAARRRERSVALVYSPVDLTDEQEDRLTRSLSRIYGRDITVAVDVDPGILGGLRIQVGDEVIDGSVAHRIDEVRRKFAR